MGVFDRASSNVPGPTGTPYRYGMHPSGLASLYVWRPVGAFADAPCAVFVHGGFFEDYGDAACSIDTFGTGAAGVANALAQLGWVVVSIELPPGAANARRLEAVSPVALFPEPEQFLAQAVQHLRGNASSSSERGPQLWGAGNSIDPSRVVLYGVGAGGTMALVSALAPDGAFPYAPAPALSLDRYTPTASHRVAAVIAEGSTWDWTQFDVEPVYTTGVTLSGDVHPHFLRPAAGLTWSGLPVRHKVAGSPYYWLQAGHSGNRSLPLYLSWAQSANAAGLNLTAADWNPGTRLSDVAGGKAFRDPAHHYQGGPVGAAVTLHGDLRSIVRWGNTGATPALTGQQFIDEVVDWLTDQLAV